MRIIERNAEAVVAVNRSKFVSNVYYVESVSEAEDIIEKTRKKYYDARHHCYAYRIIDNDNIIERQSDDGEPSGTAGGPMLNILSKKELVNILVVVTRYFGGILLGTGGLVKAYSEATKQALEQAGEATVQNGYIAEVELSYETQKEFEYICKQLDINIVKKDYSDKVLNTIHMSKRPIRRIMSKNDTRKLAKKSNYNQKRKINTNTRKSMKIRTNEKQIY